MTENDNLQEPTVSPEFIAESKQADLVKPSKKFAPYTKAQRRKRRMEVYRLHFQENWPAVRIAAALNVDKNTIQSDLKLLYERALADYNPKNMRLEDYIPKQLFRLESQRDRLAGHYVDAKDAAAKIAIERLISDIDFRIFNIISKLHYSHTKFWDAVTVRVNKMAADEKLEGRYTSITELYRISAESRPKLDKLREEAGLDD